MAQFKAIKPRLTPALKKPRPEAGPSPECWPSLGLGFFKAKAPTSQAKAGASRPSWARKTLVRENLGHIMQPLIDSIVINTKMSVTVLIESPPSYQESNYFIKVLNSGKTMDTSTPRDFHDWDEQGFKKHVV